MIELCVTIMEINCIKNGNNKWFLMILVEYKQQTL